MVLPEIGGLADDRGTLLVAGLGPVALRPGGGLGGLRDVGRRGEADASQLLAGRGLDGTVVAAAAARSSRSSRSCRSSRSRRGARWECQLRPCRTLRRWLADAEDPSSAVVNRAIVEAPTVARCSDGCQGFVSLDGNLVRVGDSGGYWNCETTSQPRFGSAFGRGSSTNRRSQVSSTGGDGAVTPGLPMNSWYALH